MEKTPMPKKHIPKNENARWACLIIFIIAVGATLLYVSSEEHSTGTIALMASVLLIGQICAALPWIIAEKNSQQKQDSENLEEKIERCLKCFEEQREHFSSAIAQIQNELNAKGTLPEKTELSDATSANLVEQIVKKIKTLPNLAQNSDEIVSEISEEIQKLETNSVQAFEDLRNLLETSTETLEGRIENLIKNKKAKLLKILSEQLDAIFEKQNLIAEKIELLANSKYEDDIEEFNENSDELSSPEDSENNQNLDKEQSEDENFPLPENMLERAQAANPNTGTAIEKMLAENVPATTNENSIENEVIFEQDFPEEIICEDEQTQFNEEEIIQDPFPQEELINPEETTPPKSEDILEENGELPLIEDLPHTALILKAEFKPGEKPFLRGKAPGLSSRKSTPMDYAGNGKWRFDFGIMKDPAEIIIFRNDTNEALGEPFLLPAGKVTTLAFDPNS